MAAKPPKTEPEQFESPGHATLKNVHTPYIPANVNLPEITIKGIVLGIVLAVLLGAANTYLGLKAGLTVAASIPAAVMSLAVLRLFRKHNILENNMVQTIASAGTSVASGAIFTIPALILLGYWEELHYWDTTFIIIIGGLMGVLFSVPIRRALIVEENLPFPEGLATGEVLKAGEKGGTGVGALFLGGALGAFHKILGGGFRLWNNEPTWTARLGGNTVAGLGFNPQPALVGVGLIIGLPIAILVFLGGVLGWFVGIPLYSALAHDAGTIFETVRQGAIDTFAKHHITPTGQQIDDATFDDLPGYIWSKRIRYVGVGAMLVGGLWSLVKLRKPLSRAVMQGIRSTRGPAGVDAAVPRTERDLPFSLVGMGSVILAIPMAVLFYLLTSRIEVALVTGLIMLVTGFLFSAVGGYMAGIVGSSNSPISGVTILALLAACLALLTMGVSQSIGPPIAVMVAGVIAVAGSISGDNLQDLKAGHMLGATPRKQQLMIILGAVASAFFIAPVIQTLINGEHVAASAAAADRLGTIQAPQANLMAALSNGIFSPDGFNMGQRWMMVAGAALAVVLIITDRLLKKAGSKWGTPVMPVAVGIYLPVGTSVPIFVGGVAAWLIERFYNRRLSLGGNSLRERWTELKEMGGRLAILFGSGLIAGEAILGIITAYLAAQGYTLGYDGKEAYEWLGLALLGAFTVVGWYVSIRPGLRGASVPSTPDVPPPPRPRM
ncbi:MAG: oligopeptide transporter, OPT family [bacterium]